MSFTADKQRFFSSWQYSEPEFSEILSLLRSAPLKEDADTTLINHSSGKMVWRLQRKNSDGISFDFACKINPGKAPWRFILRPSLAVREALNYVVFKELGVPAAHVLAVGDVRKFFILKESFIVTEFVSGTRDGRVFMPHGEMRSEHALRRSYCMLNFELLAKIHDNAVFHKAFHPRNLLWRVDGDVLKVFLIDVARCRKVKRNQLKRSVLVDIHTFIRDIQPTASELDELLEHYLNCRRNGTYPGGKEALKSDLFSFKRRLFSRKRYVICTPGTDKIVEDS